MSPGKPREPLAVGAQPRRRVEVVPRGDRNRVPLAVPVERDERVDRLGRAGGVVLAHRVEEAAPRVHLEVGMANVGIRRDRPWLGIRVLAVDALVVVVREPDGAVVHRVLAAAVFMDARPRVEARRRDVDDAPVRSVADDDHAPAFEWTAFDPVEVVAVPAAHREDELALEQKVDRDGRGPRTVRRDLRHAAPLGRRITSASPWPPPPHSAAAPTVRPRRLSSEASVSTRRAPDAPIGWPSATAPPLTLTRSSSSWSMREALRATAAKASLISTRSRSEASSPAFFSAFASASAGTVCSHA